MNRWKILQIKQSKRTKKKLKNLKSFFFKKKKYFLSYFLILFYYKKQKTSNTIIYFFNGFFFENKKNRYPLDTSSSNVISESKQKTAFAMPQKYLKLIAMVRKNGNQNKNFFIFTTFKHSYFKVSCFFFFHCFFLVSIFRKFFMHISNS